MRHFLLFVLAVMLTSSVAGAVSCTVSIPSVNFGYLPGAVTYPGSIPVNVVCPAGLTFYVNTGGGQHNAPPTGWRLGASNYYIPYSLYSDAGRTKPMGGSPGFDGITATGTGSSQVVYMSAKTYSHTDPPDTYTDNVNIRVTVSGTEVATNLSIVATVVPSCTISTTPIAFGNYNGAAVFSNATITTTCTNTTPYTISLSAGNGTGATDANRSMMNNGVLLHYTLSQDAGYSVNWGNIPNTNTPASANGTGTGVGVTLYGKLPAGQYVVPNLYTDVVIATVNY